jgi:hypothetical protein
MDYLELDDSALRVFEELGENFSSRHISSKSSISTSTALRTRPHRRVEATYLLRLETPFQSPRDVANALGLSRVPQLESGTAENGEVSFCRLSQSGINALDSWATKYHPNQKFTKIRIGLAHRDLGELPLLGRDATLPHHRPHFPVSRTEQHVLEYPVHYFFYGTLAAPARLERLLGVSASELLPLQSATLLDGRIRTWAGKYRALIDDSEAMVNGLAYVITSADQADALRAYEGDSYEVVAAKLIVDGKEMMGRAFRFAGFDDELTE